jgi:hypothetical protein
MPFYLEGFSGGLGNQVFSMATIYSLSKKYKTTFSINNSQTKLKSIGDFDIPVYIDSVFSYFIQTNEYKDKINTNINCILNVRQFIDINIPDSITPNIDNIQISGLPMKYTIFKDYIKDISTLLYNQKQKYIPYTIIETPNVRRVGVMFRTFIQESSPQWMVNIDYYTYAIQYIINRHGYNYDYEFHIYSDAPDIGQNIVKLISNKLKIYPKIYEFIGVRDNITDVKHFFQMFNLDDFILCNSTYHYWPALLSKTKDNKLVTFPSYTQDGNNIDWFKHIVPETWVQL